MFETVAETPTGFALSELCFVCQILLENGAHMENLNNPPEFRSNFPYDVGDV
jgi:hypothetical protein